MLRAGLPKSHTGDMRPWTDTGRKHARQVLSRVADVRYFESEFPGPFSGPCPFPASAALPDADALVCPCP